MRRGPEVHRDPGVNRVVCQLSLAVRRWSVSAEVAGGVELHMRGAAEIRRVEKVVDKQIDDRVERPVSHVVEHAGSVLADVHNLAVLVKRAGITRQQLESANRDVSVQRAVSGPGVCQDRRVVDPGHDSAVPVSRCGPINIGPVTDPVDVCHSFISVSKHDVDFFVFDHIAGTGQPVRDSGNQVDSGDLAKRTAHRLATSRCVLITFTVDKPTCDFSPKQHIKRDPDEVEVTVLFGKLRHSFGD